MDRKTLAIGVLVLTALALAGVVVSGLRTERAAYAQGGVYATYVGATAEVRDDLVHFIVADTSTRRMIFYEFNPSDGELRAADGRQLTVDFKRSER